jgi:hypothetical protein
MAPIDTTSIWTNSTLSVLNTVKKRGCVVTVECSRPCEDGFDGVVYTGHLSLVSGMDVTFRISGEKIQLRKGGNADGACTVSFVIDRGTADGDIERIGYRVKGVLQGNVATVPGKVPGILDIRISPQFSMRRMRRDERLTWDIAWTKLFCLALADEHPERPEDIHRVVGDQLKKAIDIRLRDVSAGGASVLISCNTEHAEVTYMGQRVFFLVPTAMEAEKPYVLSAKKVGILRGSQPDQSILRLRFTHELDWGKSGTALAWADVERTGSSRLRQMIEQILLEHIPVSTTDTPSGKADQAAS